MAKVLLLGGLVFDTRLFTPLINPTNYSITNHANNRAEYSLIDLNSLSAKHGLDAVCANLAPLITNSREKLVLVAYSSGALCAIKLALNFPAQIGKLVLINASPCFMEQVAWAGISPANFARLKGKLNDLALVQFLDHFAALAAYPEVKQANALVQYYSEHNHPETLSQWFTILQHSDLRQELQHLKSKLVTIYSAQDSLVPTQLIHPRAEQLILEGATHGQFITPQLLQHWPGIIHD